MRAVLRSATSADLAALEELDLLCFPPNDPDRERAAEGEIEQAVASGCARILTVDATIVASLLYEVPVEDHVYISGLGVHPDWRGHGYASLLLDDLLERESVNTAMDKRSISTVTGPGNFTMLRLLLSRGFVVRRLLTDYFGPGRDRYYCQYKVKPEYIDPDERFILPASAQAQIGSMLATGRYALTALAGLPARPVVEMSRFEGEDVASLQSAETDAGVQFTAGILAAITFLLGISLTSPNYPDAVRIVLIAAAVATTVSLSIYANASGELTRLRSNVFSHHQKWGNVLSEFGGVYPFLVSLPVALGFVSSSLWVGLGSALFVTAALVVYEHSAFSIIVRFRQTILTRALSAVIAASPIAGVLVVRRESQVAAWIWATIACAALAALSALFLARHEGESLTPRLARRWQSRR
jgi:ribosomal protein S18 acetylase RimI-like enzyme